MTFPFTGMNMYKVCVIQIRRCLIQMVVVLYSNGYHTRSIHDMEIEIKSNYSPFIVQLNHNDVISCSIAKF